jgi:uncharacterized membrane protein YfcA
VPHLSWLLPPEFTDASLWVWLGLVWVFTLGGIVKGVLGVGLPLVVVPLLSLFLPTPTAIALVGAPVLVSNLWQTYDSRASRHNLMRFWPLTLSLLLSTLVTVPLTLNLPAAVLNSMMAAALLTSIALMAFNPNLRIAPRWERWAGGLVGTLSGAMGGVSSLTGPVIITFLMALQLKREEFIGTISVIYLFGAVPLYVALWFGRLELSHLLVSALAMAPMSLGLSLGKRVRQRVSELLFRRILLVFLLCTAIALITK